MPLIHSLVLQSDPLVSASVIDGFYLVVEAGHLTHHTFSRSGNAIIQAIDEMNTSAAGLPDLMLLFSAFNESFADAGTLFTRLNLFAGFLSDLTQFPLQAQFEDKRSTAISQSLPFEQERLSFLAFYVRQPVNTKTETRDALCLYTDMFSGRQKTSSVSVIASSSRGNGKQCALYKAIDLFLQSQFYERA
jgi:hypothetical protein